VESQGFAVIPADLCDLSIFAFKCGQFAKWFAKSGRGIDLVIPMRPPIRRHRA